MVRSFGFLLGFACLALSAPIMAADSNISDLERNALLQARLARYITPFSASVACTESTASASICLIWAASISVVGMAWFAAWLIG